MYLKPTFLASQRRTPIVRFLETSSPVAPSHVVDRVRILGLIANPHGSAQLNVGAEREKVDKALEKVRKERTVDVDWLDPATPRRLRQVLQEDTYHILHFVGHSDFVGGEGVLLLEDEAGGQAMVSAAQFVNLLGDQAAMRLVVLNSCEGSRTDASDPFAGLATSIVALGVPAVVAMQFEITDKAAITFAE
jgi:CHAT domain-containing protein